MIEIINHIFGTCGDSHANIFILLNEWPLIKNIIQMKCLKSNKTGNIVRVSDKQADQMVGSEWQLIPKSEWKLATREAKSEEIEVEQEKKEITVSKKAEHRSKLKSKQRQLDDVEKVMYKRMK